MKIPEPKLVFGSIGRYSFYAWEIETKELRVLGNTKAECVRDFKQALIDEEILDHED